MHVWSKSTPVLLKIESREIWRAASEEDVSAAELAAGVHQRGLTLAFYEVVEVCGSHRPVDCSARLALLRRPMGRRRTEGRPWLFHTGGIKDAASSPQSENELTDRAVR